ncbi:Bug family tripartite tricarboxylate transporter substrate binding protein [Pigmentiphaga litoralis]|uniref:Bug family tripartite tricarboxylate transporter substrate binding protein n=1 Tax=Pigmentiphaga litoralis TaxID=516702 RepID=UPI003B429890
MKSLMIVAALAGVAIAQASRADTVQAIVPFPAGGPLDLVARIITAKMQQGTSDVFVVDNRGGANGMIGAKAAGLGEANGKNLLFADGAMVTVNPKLYPKDASFDVEKDLRVVASVALQPAVLVVNPAITPTDVKGFIEYGRKSPINYASGGIGSQGHLTMASFANATKLEMTHVPYKGGAPAMNDLVGGQIPAAFVGVAGAIGFIKSGRLRALAVSSDRRVPILPDVPTVTESGVPGFSEQGAYFVMVPARTPDAVVQALATKVMAAAADKDVQDKLKALGLTPSAMDTDAAAKWLASEKVRMAKLIAANNVRAE